MAARDGSRRVGPGTDLSGEPSAGPDGWRPFGPVDEHLRVGPGLAVARGDGRRGPGTWRVLPRDHGRALLLEHGFRMDPALRRAAESVPPGVPVPDAVRRLRAALPGFVVLEQGPFSAVLARVPEAVVLLDGPRGELEGVGWHSGPEALELVSAHLDALGPVGLGPDVVEVPLDPPDGRRLLRSVVLALAVLVLAPVLAAPVLLTGDAVLWFLATGGVWVAGILGGRRLLTSWEERRPRRWVRLDPWRLWLPSGLGPVLVDRGKVEVEITWHPEWGASTMGAGGRAPASRNPATTHVHLQGPDLALTLTAADTPQEPRPRQLERQQLGVGGTWVGVPWRDLRRLRSVLEGAPRA